MHRTMRRETDPIHLTPRQREIVALIWAGHTNKAMAERLKITVKTVEAHRAMLHAKYRTTNTAQLLKALMRDGVIHQGGA